jgi:hypothetical protein
MKIALIDIDTLALCHPAQILCLTYLVAEIRADSVNTVKYIEGKRNTVVFSVGKDSQTGLADKSTLEYHKNIGNQALLDQAARLTPEDNVVRLQALSQRFKNCKALLFTHSSFQVNQINVLLNAYGFNSLYNCLDLKTMVYCCTRIDPNMKFKKSKTVDATEILNQYSKVVGNSSIPHFLINNFGG